MTDLKKVPEKDLKAELTRRGEILKQEEMNRLKLHRDLVQKHIETLLLFVPNHDRPVCSDENPCSHGTYKGRVYCNRCRLLWIMRNNVNIDTSVYLDVRIEEDP